MRLGFLGRAGPPDDRLWLRKIRSWDQPYLNSKIIGAESVRSFIGYSGWPITLQLPFDTLASLCKLIGSAVPLWCAPASLANI